MSFCLVDVVDVVDAVDVADVVGSRVAVVVVVVVVVITWCCFYCCGCCCCCCCCIVDHQIGVASVGSAVASAVAGCRCGTSSRATTVPTLEQ